MSSRSDVAMSTRDEARVLLQEHLHSRLRRIASKKRVPPRHQPVDVLLPARWLWPVRVMVGGGGLHAAPILIRLAR